VAGRWFSHGKPVSSINKTDRHDIFEILLKVALNTINQMKDESKELRVIRFLEVQQEIIDFVRKNYE